MPQSLVKNYVHITFSTKERYPFIDKVIAKKLQAYLGGICKNPESPPLENRGLTDHIHIICPLSEKATLMKLVETLKTHSSKWIKTRGDTYQKLYWQNGYGRFPVNPSEEEIVRKHILKQEGHHKKRTFQDKNRAFLKKYNVEYNKQYVRD